MAPWLLRRGMKRDSGATLLEQAQAEDSFDRHTSDALGSSVDVWINLPAADEPKIGVRLHDWSPHPPTIAELMEGRAKDCFQLIKGDTLLLINGSRPSSAAEATEMLEACTGAEIRLQVRRALQATVELVKPRADAPLGLAIKGNREKRADQRHVLVVESLVPGGIAHNSGRFVVGAAVTHVTARFPGEDDPTTYMVDSSTSAAQLMRRACGTVSVHVRYD